MDVFKYFEAFIVNRCGVLNSADLGTSSNHSNGVQCFHLGAFDALKAVVEKVSLILADMQGLVGPKS